jgi:hypothetical protein
VVPPFIKPAPTETSGAFPSVTESQVTDSEGHPWNSRKRGSGDIGGEFYTRRTYVISKPTQANLSITTPLSGGNYKVETYQGPAFPVTPNTVAFPPDGRSSVSRLSSDGATAVARCKPTNSVADAAVFLGELLTGGLPHALGSQAWKSRTQVGKGAGSEYLNVQFGWKPLLNDVSQFATAVKHASDVLKQYERDAGKVVRRRYNFPSSRSVEFSTVATGVAARLPPGITAFTDSANLGSLIRRRETLQRKWFSGAFTYHLPVGYDSRSKMDTYALYADKILGASLTPDTLWNLAPWSWAIDWFSNTGDVISNLSDWATDGLVMRYGYIMEHTIVSDSYSIDKSGTKTLSGSVGGLTYVSETKVRHRANPFGFGLTWDGLSPSQLAIAAALGLSRS